MRCPHCQFEFKVLAANAREIPDLAPIVCEGCCEVSLLDRSNRDLIRKMDDVEMAAIKLSPAWKGLILPAQIAIGKLKKMRSAVLN